MKSTASWTTSTMYSLAPMPSNGGISYDGSLSSEIFSPQPECENPTTPPLRLAPLEHGQVPARPFLDPRRARVVVFLEPQQAEMAGVRRGEAGDLDVVAHQVFGRRERVDLALEELLLGVPARPPRQHAADVEVFAQDVPPHVLGLDPFGRALVMRAAGRVDVMIAGEPVQLREVESSA